MAMAPARDRPTNYLKGRHLNETPPTPSRPSRGDVAQTTAVSVEIWAYLAVCLRRDVGLGPPMECPPVRIFASFCRTGGRAVHRREPEQKGKP